MAKLVTFDWECSGAQRNKANPYDPRNEGVILCTLERDTVTKETVTTSFWGSNPLHMYDARKPFEDANFIIGMNLKYDAAWCRRYKIPFPENSNWWDIQVVHFIMTGQVSRFPSLNDILTYHELELKKDVVKEEYWEKGLDTDDVPEDILDEYCSWDVQQTYAVAQIQMRMFKNLTPKLQTTIRLALEDEKVLFDMEYNGFLFDTQASLAKGQELEQLSGTIRNRLSEITNTQDLNINWGSNDQISAVLYGGIIKRKRRETYEFVYTTVKKGRPPSVMKERWVEDEHELPRRFEPLPKSEMAKAGIFATNEPTLRKLKSNKANREIIELLLQLAKVDKLYSTYFYGLPKIIEEKGWTDNYIHCGLNQCVVITGRLSSTGPNLQNQPEDNQFCFLSRFN